MSMHTALSGLNAAQTDISATSHNIANIGTVGFRGSRVEFAEIYNSSPYTLSRTTTGSGTQVLRVSQDFAQGNITTTGNRLDLAIEGQGFFAIQPTLDADEAPSEIRFTRSGAFSMDSNGKIVNSSGHALLGWPVAADGTNLNGTLTHARSIEVPRLLGEAQATSEINLNLSIPTDPTMLGAQAAVPPAAAFDPADNTTWALRTPVPMTDTAGNAVEAELYMIRMDDPDALSAETTFAFRLVVNDVDQGVLSATDAVTFDADGLALSTTTPLQFGTASGSYTLDLSASTLADRPFSVEAVDHNGQSTSMLTGIDIDAEGTIWANYGADERVAVSKLMLANFTNPGGLRVLGNSSFAATAESGPILVGEPGTMGFGMLRSGALEKANVDLTEELVNLITAQRNYQANAKSMETSSSMMQTIINIRT